MRRSAGALHSSTYRFSHCIGKESDGITDRNGLGGKLEEECWKGQWKVENLLHAGLTIKLVMEGQISRIRHVPPGGIKLFYAQPLDLRNSFADEFTLLAWSAYFGLFTFSVAASPCSLCAIEVTFPRSYHNGKTAADIRMAESRNGCPKQRLFEGRVFLR